jgi:hypothetical protein
MYVAVDVVHVRILGLAIWANYPIVIKEFDWCPTKITRFAFFRNVKAHFFSDRNGYDGLVNTDYHQPAK